MSVPPELMNAMPGADLSGLPAPAGMQPSKYARKPVAKQPVARSGMSFEPTAMQAASDAGAEGEKMLMSDLGQYRSDVGRVRQASQEADAYEREHPPEMPATFQEQAPQYADFAKQVSPLLMIATVLGGKAMGISAQGMLGAVTGMVEGTAEGNEQRYAEAYKNYQDHYKRFKEDEANRVAYRDKMLEWYKGRIDAPQLAAQASLQLVNAGEKIVNMGVNADKVASQVARDLDKQYLALAKLHTQIAEQDAKMQQLRYNAVNKELGKSKDLEIAADRLQDQFSKVESAWNELEKAAASDPSLKNMIDTGAAFNSQTMQRLNAISSQAVAKFNAAASNLIGPALREINQGLPAGALRAVKVEYREMDALPSLEKGWNTAKEAIESVRYRVEKAKEESAKRKMDALRNYQSTGSPFYNEQDLLDSKKPSSNNSAPAAPKPSNRPEGVPENAKQADDGNWYAPDPSRPGKYLKY